MAFVSNTTLFFDLLCQVLFPPPTFLVLLDKLHFFQNQCHSVSRYYNPLGTPPLAADPVTYPFRLTHPVLGHRRALHLSFIRPLSCSNTTCRASQLARKIMYMISASPGRAYSSFPHFFLLKCAYFFRRLFLRCRTELPNRPITVVPSITSCVSRISLSHPRSRVSKTPSPERAPRRSGYTQFY